MAEQHGEVERGRPQLGHVVVAQQEARAVVALGREHVHRARRELRRRALVDVLRVRLEHLGHRRDEVAVERGREPASESESEGESETERAALSESFVASS